MDAPSTATRRWNPLVLFLAILLTPAIPAVAAINATPASTTLYPGETSGSVALNLSFPATPIGMVISGAVLVTGLPPGASTVPAGLALNIPGGSTSAATSFQVATTGATPPGTYPISFTTSPDVGAGVGTFTLVVQAPSFSTTIAPPALSLAWGDSRPVTVSTTTIGPFSTPVTYSFSGFPAGISTGGSQTVGPPFAPATFTVSVASGTAPGVHSGFLVATWPAPVPQTRTTPFIITVAQPTITASFIPAAVNLVANGAAQSTNLTLTPGSGYTGTPILTMLAAPPGIEITPAALVAAPMPPGQSIPLSVRATTAAPGLHTLTVRITDAAALIDTTAALSITVAQSTITATFTPAALTLLARGPAQQTTLTLTPGAGYTGTPALTITGAPPGLEITPPTLTAAPMPPAQSIPISIRATTATGVHTIVVRVVDPVAHIDTSASLAITIVQPSIGAAFNPASITIAASGAPATTNLTLTPLNGYTGTPTLTLTGAPPNLELSPPTLTALPLPPTQTIPISVRAIGPATGTHSITVRVTDVAAGLDTTATLAVTVTPPADATISVNPTTLRLTAGRSADVTVTAAGTNGFSGTLNVTAPVATLLTFTPSAFSLRAGESRTVTIAASSTMPAGPVRATFTAVSPDLGGSRMATVVITVVRPSPEIASVLPQTWAAATVGTRVRITGANFVSGATVTFTPPGPVVTSSIVSSATAAEIVVTTPPNTKPGAYRIDLRNPDGLTTAQGATVVVYAVGSLGGPVGVSTAATVFPRPYATVAYSEPLYPRAVIATTGVGSIVGTWRLDGVPFDQFVVAASGGLPVEVKAKMPVPVSTAGEHRLELVIEQPQQITAEAVPVILTIESRTALRIVAPEDGAVIRDEPPIFRWTLVPGASGYLVELLREGDAASRKIRLSDSEWRPDAKAMGELGTGAFRIRVAAVFPGEVTGEPTPWRSFVIEEPQAREKEAQSNISPYLLASLRHEDEEEQAAEAVAPPATLSVWSLGLSGFGSDTDEENHVGGDAARVQLTSQAAIEDARFAMKETTDVSERKDLDPQYDAASESRAWQGEVAAIQERFREELHAGYSPPDFLDRSEFLAAGLARGGALARQVTPIGSFSYYDTFYDDAAGAVSAYDLSQQVSGAAWQAPFDPNRTILRLIGLRSRSNSDDSYSSDAVSEALGLFWQHTFSPALTLAIEGANGNLDDPAADDVDGNAFRLSANGTSGTLTWMLNARHTESGFVNPVNAGLTPGAIPDRTGADVTLMKLFGQKNLMVQLRTQASGGDASVPGGDMNETTGALTFTMPLGTVASLTASSSVSMTTGDGDAESYVPETDRTMTALGVTFSEAVKGFTLAQSLTWQDVSDDIFAFAEQTVSGVSVSGNGAIGSSTMVTALLSGTRSEAAPVIGTTDSYLGSLQPTFMWRARGLSMTPSVSYSRSESDASTSETEQYQLLLQWTPAWWQSLFAIQFATDWNKAATEGFPSAGYHRRVIANVTLRWGISRPSPATAPAVTPVAALAQMLYR